VSPGRVDPAVIRRHLLALERAVQHLSRHTGRPIDKLITDLDEAWLVERGLQVCAQNALDVATHIAAAGATDAPDYGAAIDALVQLGALPPDFGARFRAVAGFRNILVHGYLELDPSRVHAVLNTRLQEFREFARYIEEYLGRV